MAAFTAADPTDRGAFMAKWTRILGDDAIPIRTILFEGHVAGSVLCWTDEELGKPEVSYMDPPLPSVTSRRLASARLHQLRHLTVQPTGAVSAMGGA